MMDTFDALPLCAILNKQYFCVHGGISPSIQRVEQILDIKRFIAPPSSRDMCDLLWSDPMDDFNIESEKFEPNTVRGCSYSFSFSAACEFLENNRLLSVIRAHEAQDAGYKMHRRNDKTGFPSVITLFSAPNYLSSYNNKGAILRYENNVINIRQFNNSPSPYYLPGFMNVFKWSLPFVAEKLGELLLSVFKLVDDEQAEVEEREQIENIQKINALRRKVQTVGRLCSIFRQIRQEREELILAGSLSPRGDSLPTSLQRKPEEHNEMVFTLSRSLHTFEGTKTIDLPNEARPPPLSPSAAPPSPDSLKRALSRDSILNAKRLSRGSLKNVTNQVQEQGSPVAPDIKEEKV